MSEKLALGLMFAAGAVLGAMIVGGGCHREGMDTGQAMMCNQLGGALVRGRCIKAEQVRPEMP